MSQVPVDDVFTPDEVARAAGVALDAVRELLRRGELGFIAGTQFINVVNPLRTAGRLREVALTQYAQPSTSLFAAKNGARNSRRPLAASLLAHATVALIAVLLSMGPTQTAPLDEPVHEESHLVFLLSPGPGGGGGGGGMRQPRPAPKIARRGESHVQVSVPAVSEKPVITTAREEAPKPTPVEPVIQPPPEPAPEPVPAKVIVAPVETLAANNRDRQGVIEHGAEGPDSNGPGSNGGVGSGQGTGNGEGLGTGIGDGQGGGTGGGPYRPGSGIEPPRLLREVKAQYTEDARRRGITGDVLLEIVVRRDGSVGDVHVLQGLGYGLEERAIAAVRQWRFDAARRQGLPVDVLVEVAVEFTLR
jgi:periplasmic protein TonB